MNEIFKFGDLLTVESFDSERGLSLTGFLVEFGGNTFTLFGGTVDEILRGYFSVIPFVNARDYLEKELIEKEDFQFIFGDILKFNPCFGQPVYVPTEFGIDKGIYFKPVITYTVRHQVIVKNIHNWEIREFDFCSRIGE